jgi:beta-glucosidase
MVSWPRVFPCGAGAPNPQGRDFNHRMGDALLVDGIQSLRQIANG